MASAAPRRRGIADGGGLTGEFDLFGVFIPALLVWALIAFAASAGMRWVMRRFRLYRFVWHRPLFDLALFVVVLGGVVSLLPRLGALAGGAP